MKRKIKKSAIKALKNENEKAQQLFLIFNQFSGKEY
jgi:hypothetical protein